MAKVKAMLTRKDLDRLGTGATVTIKLPPNATVLELVFDDRTMQEFNSLLEKIFKL